MKSIQNTFLTKTIPSFFDAEVNMTYLRFVLDEESLNNLEQNLNPAEADSYRIGLSSIRYLRQIRKEYEDGVDAIYIPVHDSSKFFSFLQEIVELYSKRKNKKLSDSDYFLRSIWLRMGPSDIENVEEFLKRQLTFLKNDSLIPEYKEIQSLGDEDVISYRIHENDDWFETNQRIVFSVRRNSDDIYDQKDYDFPGIHYGLAKESGIPTCFIYGIQTIGGMQDEDIKQDLQPIRKSLRNEYCSADFLIALSLFFDYLYDHHVRDIEIPTLQVFNYPYHEYLSSHIQELFDEYTEDEKKEYEFRYSRGVRSGTVLDYMRGKKLVSRFVDKQDLISHNKTERLIQILLELVDRFPSVELESYPLQESENMRIHLNGKMDLLQNSFKKEKTV